MKSIETERLILKPYTLDDAEELYAYACNPNVGPHAGWKPHESVEESRRIIKELFIPVEGWAIRLKENGTLIGTISLEDDRYRPGANSKEIGYSLDEAHWGFGYGTEAAKAVLKFAFEELHLDQVGIVTSKVNKRSQRIIEKCGFTYEGTIRRTYKIYDGSMRDSLIFSMLREEYDERKEK